MFEIHCFLTAGLATFFNIFQYFFLFFTDKTHISKFLQGNDKFPIIFKSIKGKEFKANDFSFYNKEEQTCVIQLIEELFKTKLVDADGKQLQLTQSDIGVVSPYRKQCTMLSKELQQRKMNKITVGTAEVFQPGAANYVNINSSVQRQIRFRCG